MPTFNAMNFLIPTMYVGVFIFSFVLTSLARSYALRRAIIDVPNQRSSHQVPTPRGGGIAIVLTFSMALLTLFLFGLIQSPLTLALVGGGILIAGIGYYDDVYSLSAKWRFLFHFLVAGWGIYWLGNVAFMRFTIFNSLLTAFGIVWCINFYNFMDGIDGIAGLQGIFVGLSCTLILSLLGVPNLALVTGLLSTAIAAFMLWNWPPAKIFLGDVGSGYLGYILAVFGLYTVNQQILSIPFWSIILGVFFCDATLTLFYRIWQRKKWYEAHREHAYQNLIAFGFSHKKISLSILILNILLIFPLAIAALYYPQYSYLLFGITIFILSIIWYSIKFKLVEK